MKIRSCGDKNQKYTAFSRTFGLLRNDFGQGLLETVIGIVVILVAFAVISGIVVKSLSITGATKNEAEAIRIASQRMELMRNLRDTTLWDDFSEGCYIITGGIPQFEGPSPCSYSQTEENKKFKERIIVSGIDADTRKVEVDISYMQDLKEKEISLISNLTNWRVR